MSSEKNDAVLNQKVGTTFVLSDFHLADVEPVGRHSALWKRFKRPKHFVDESFRQLLERLRAENEGQLELVFNGDIFDFDSVMAIPERPEFPVSWLERRRGLSSEEPKSRFKMEVILSTHPVWLQAVRDFVCAGHRVVFNIGNHDMELHWPSVRQDLLDRLNLPEDRKEAVSFTEWFYISGGDTLIEHGNQYDAYCLCSNPINPLIRKGSRIFVRLPFGNLAGKFMVNGMGLFNPHVDSSFIKESVWEYAVFFMKYVVRVQPFLLVTWFWGALVTLVVSLHEGFHRALSDPLTIGMRIEDIAARAGGTPQMVWALKEVHAHPAIFNPVKILRELWLDRAVLLGLVFYGSFQFFAVASVFANVSLWWAVIPLFLFLPMLIFYARSVESEVGSLQKVGFEMTPLSARIAKVGRVIQGHTHRELHTEIEGIEYVNTGTWSPAFHDVECTQPYGRKCYARLKPDPMHQGHRVCELLEWTGQESAVISREKIDSNPLKTKLF